MEMKNIFIMGDSYSTYRGYIPEGYSCYYSEDRADKPFVTSVTKTWWKIFEKENSLNIVFNDSFSGSTVCNTVRETFPISSSFVSRIDKYISEDFFAKNNVDTMLIFGGTNDSWINAPIGENKYENLTEEDLKCILPAFCYLIEKAKNAVKNITVILNTGLKPEITEGIIEICEKNEIGYLCLKDIDKENGHPTELGMKQIAEQLTDFLNK